MDPLGRGDGPPRRLLGFRAGGPASQPLQEGVCAQRRAQMVPELCERLRCIRGDLTQAALPEGDPPLGSWQGCELLGEVATGFHAAGVTFRDPHPHPDLVS